MCTSAVDFYRGLPCPLCLPRLPETIETPLGPLRLLSSEAEGAKDGFVFKNMKTSSWQCDRCNKKFQDSDLGIAMEWEERLQQEVQMLEGGGGVDRERSLLQHLAHSLQVLGSQHWCSKRIQFLLCQYYAGEKYTTRYSLEQLESLIEALWKWLERGEEYFSPAAYLEVVLRRASEIFFKFGRVSLAQQYAERCYGETEASCGAKSEELCKLQALLQAPYE